MRTKFIFIVLFILLIFNSAFSSTTDQLSEDEETTGWNMVQNFLSGKDKGEPVRFRKEILIKITGNYTKNDSLGLVKLVSELRTLIPFMGITSESKKANVFLDINLLLPRVRSVSGALTEMFDRNNVRKLYLYRQVIPISLDTSMTQEQRDRTLTFYLLRSLTGNRSNWSTTTVPGTIFGQDNPLESQFTALDHFVIQQIYAPDFDNRFREHLGIGVLKYNFIYHFSIWKPKIELLIFSLVLLALFLVMHYGVVKIFLRWQRFVAQWMLLSFPFVFFIAIMNIRQGSNLKLVAVILLGLFIFYTVCFVAELFFVNPNKPASTRLKVKFIIPVVMVIFTLMFYMTLVHDLRPEALIVILLSTILVSAVRIGFENYRYNTRQEINQHDVEMAKLQELITKAELQAINARINPHFLYNSLNSIATLVHTDPDKTEKMTIGLSDFLRYAINRQGADMVSLAEELEITGKYLEIEKVRFGERLNYCIDTSPEADRIIVPRFVLQPIVENAVKHGISPIKEGGMIRIQCLIEAKKLSICVYDNGPGFAENIMSGYGLTSLNDKLSLIYGQTPELFWVNGDQKHICVKIPLNKNG